MSVYAVIMVVRLLVPGDEDALEAFLAPRRASSMFLRSNPRAVGLVDDGRPLSGTYAGGFVDGTLVAVAAHLWNGAVLVQAPTGAAEVVRAVCAATKRAVTMISEPMSQVGPARDALGLANAVVAHPGEEILALRDLHVPDRLAGGELIGRVAERRWREVPIAWRLAYVAEALGAANDDAARTAAAEHTDRVIAGASGFVVATAAEPDRPLAFACYNAALLALFNGRFLGKVDIGRVNAVKAAGAWAAEARRVPRVEMAAIREVGPGGDRAGARGRARSGRVASLAGPR